MSNYDANSIKQLKGLQAVRLRPGMYIGSTSNSGLHHLIWEIVDNGVDEALAGYATTIDVRICKDNSIVVRDDGRGAPSAWNSEENMSALEMIFTKLHAGGKFDNNSYKTSGGLHGVGASVTNALSSRLEVEVHRDGKKYTQYYIRGERQCDVLEEPYNLDDTGTIVRFWPDEIIFKDGTEINYKIVQERLKTKAYINKGIRFVLTDDRNGVNEEFYYPNGIVQFVKDLNESKNPLFPDPIYVTNEFDLEKERAKVLQIDSNEFDEKLFIEFEVALQYNESYDETVKSFVNVVSTPNGGTHEIGFRNALTRSINEYAEERGLVKTASWEKFEYSDVKEGLTAIISVKHPDPQFEGQTKEKLGSSEVRSIIYNAFKNHFNRFLEENPEIAVEIVKKAIKAQEVKNAALKARDNAREKKEVKLSTTLPGKLADCTSKDPEKSEIFFVEGDSAGGSAKQGRSRFFQAILPLRGKVINVEKAADNGMSNQEVLSIITALGAGYKENFDIESIRYHKIVIMTDADVDGAHIRTLLLTFFYRFFPQVIEAGYLYIAQPPLFKIIKGKKNWYVHSEQEKNEILASFKENEKYNVQRFKGLGEMNADQLWETTMDPETRYLRRVTIEDAMAVEKIVTDLMGGDVEPRKIFIQEHALEADIDV